MASQGWALTMCKMAEELLLLLAFSALGDFLESCNIYEMPPQYILAYQEPY
jgi:hypothetical protein